MSLIRLLTDHGVIANISAVGVLAVAATLAGFMQSFVKCCYFFLVFRAVPVLVEKL